MSRRSNLPLYPEHDLEVSFDINFTNEDLFMVNKVRMMINLILHCEPGMSVISWDGAGLALCQDKARRYLLDSINTRIFFFFFRLGTARHRDLNHGPLACEVDALTTMPSPHPDCYVLNFKAKVITELCRPGVFYSTMIDETPKPEQRMQQLDIQVRYFSESKQQVTVEHLMSFNLGRATRDIIVDHIEEALAELPRNGLLSFFSDGPNVMNNVKSKVKQRVNANLLDIGECSLHKVHNAFAKGLDVFCSDVEELVRDVYYSFKHAVRAEVLKEQQEVLNTAPHVLLRHVSNRWLTLQDSLSRIQEQFPAIRHYFLKDVAANRRFDAQTQHKRLASAFSSRTLYTKVLFLRNTAELFAGFQRLFLKQEPLFHFLHEELVALVQRVLNRVLCGEVFCEKSAQDLMQLDLDDSALWKAQPELGADTEKAMDAWDPVEKKAFRLGALFFFFLACGKALLKTLPLANKVIKHARFLTLNYASINKEVQSVQYLAGQLPGVVTDL
ncbi:hypothetical protein HPB51_016502 [Rhipicephalus microplus]|uniref:Uncharacterized protein n=1 Tax=Rhipicephalus microplus TaxID=6941 RepID=A0A9J6E2K2_RHIMP|nr:hypothetical protein HPB51_016502 [Rhipicephalus microplus]